MEDTSNFQLAVAAINAGRIADLSDLITRHPELIRIRLPKNEFAYFKDPYLLWFIADNPIRTGKLPANILEITRLLIRAVKQISPETYQLQVDYAFVLVASGHTPAQCGVQIEMINLLADAGASPDAAMTALTNGNLAAAQHLLDLGGKVNLAIAVCLGRTEDISQLIKNANKDETLTALAAASFYGNAGMVKYLLEMSTDPNGFPPSGSGFHSHATPLHQAVSSGCLECVEQLVEAGADLTARDKVYDGTPLEWAAYLQSEDSCDDTRKNKLSLIETFLLKY